MAGGLFALEWLGAGDVRVIGTALGGVDNLRDGRFAERKLSLRVVIDRFRGFGSLAVLAALFALALALGEHFRLAGGDFPARAAAFPPVAEFQPPEAETGLREADRVLAGEHDHRDEISAAGKDECAGAADDLGQRVTADPISHNAARAVREIATRRPIQEKVVRRVEERGAG